MGKGGFYISQPQRHPNHKPYLSFSIAGTEAFCNSDCDYLASNAKVAQRKIRQQGKLWILAYERMWASRIHDLLYRDATVYLARKTVANPGSGYFAIDADRLRRLRQDRSLTHAGLCEKSGLSQQTVFRLESGWVRQDRVHSKPRGVHSTTLRKLADALGIEPPNS